MAESVVPGGEKILIRSAAAFDPSQRWKGTLRDLYIAGGRLAEPFRNPDRTIDVQGRPVLAGGIEPHGLFAAPGLVFLDGCKGAAEGPRELGEAYARMGYVHVHQPLATLMTAGLVRHRLNRLLYVDASYSVALDLRDVGSLVRAGRGSEIARFARGLLQLSGGIGVFLASPYLKHRQRHYIQKNLTAKKVLAALSGLGDEELFPVRMLGAPGLLDEPMERPGLFHVCGLGRVLEAPGGLEACFEFLDRGGSGDLSVGMEVEDLVVSCPPESGFVNLTVDMGFPFPVSFSIRRISPEETLYRNALALLDRTERAWHLSLSLSGLTGGLRKKNASFLARFLCEGYRVRKGSGLGSWDAEGLYALAGLTRLEPARSLGLKDLGHLRVGARACLTVYDLSGGTSEDRLAEALADCWCLIKDGVVIREEGTFTGLKPPRRVFGATVGANAAEWRGLDLFENATLRFENLGPAGIGE